MKHLIKTIFGLSIAALLTVFISCPQPAGPGGGNSGTVTPVPESPGGGNNGTVTPVPESPVEKALGGLTVSPVQVYNGTDKVDLPITTSIAGVTIEWTAEPADYIKTEDPDRGKILKREPVTGTEKTEVTLTAKATKDGEVKTKTFKIIIYPATVEPDAQALASSLACPASVSQDFTLQKNVDGYPTATIAWESADDKIIKIESGSGTDIKGIIGYDLIDRTVKLTATVNYNSGIGTKDFNVTVEHFANKIKREDSKYIREYEFTGTELVITETKKDDNVLQRGVKYEYTDAQTVADGIKTALFTKTAQYDKDKEKWVTRQEYLQEQQSLLATIFNELQNLKNKDPLQLSDFKTLCSILNGSNMEGATDVQIFNMCKGILGLSENNYAQFNALGEVEKSKKLKQGILHAETIFNESLTAIVTGRFPSRRYIYSFNGSGTNLRFNTSLPYDSGKPWYEQKGGYDFQSSVQNNASHPAPAGTIMFIYFRVNKSGANTYSAYIAVHKADGSGNEPQCDNRSSQAPFTPPNSPVTATLVEDGNPSNQLSIEIKDIDDAGDGTMSANIKIDSGVFESYTLKFRGNSLPLY